MTDLRKWREEKRKYELEVSQLHALLEEYESREMDMSNIYREENSSTGMYKYTYKVENHN